MLARRISFTVGALLVYRLGLLIPLPGIDAAVLEQIFRPQSGGVLDAVNMLSGGAVARLSILALSVFPYLWAAVLVQLMTTVAPQLERLRKEGEQGRKVIDQITRHLTVFLAIFQSYGIAIGLEGAGPVVS